jgi:hypothetical protein
MRNLNGFLPFHEDKSKKDSQNECDADGRTVGRRTQISGDVLPWFYHYCEHSHPWDTTVQPQQPRKRMFKAIRSLSYSASKRDATLKASALIVTTVAAASCTNTFGITLSHCTCEQDEEERNFRETLNHHKNQLEDYKQKWNWHNHSSRIPTVSWPTNIPDEDMIGSLKTDLKFCNRRKDPKDKQARFCQNLKFRIASFMMLQQDGDSQRDGLALLKQLAEDGHGDGICAYATALNDGRGGLEFNPDAAVSWWMNASEKCDHIQSNYELGVAFYTGEGVPEDEAIAVDYFRRAADCGHAGASYMLGDCLLDGIGVERDRAEALEWLIISAELGHRGARSRVCAVLEKEEGRLYGDFTDASRQTLISWEKHSAKTPDAASFEDGKKRDGLERQYSLIPVSLERRFTIGGGANNPSVLGRRKSIVGESRHV